MKNRRLKAALAVVALSGLLASCGHNGADDAMIYGRETAEPAASSEETVSVSFFGYKADAINLIAIESAIHGFGSLTLNHFEINRKASNGFIFLSKLKFIIARYL